MAIIHVPRRAYRQPQGRFAIDPSFFLAENLVLAVDPATLIDYVSGSLPTAILRGGTTSVGAGANGRALVGANSWVAAAYADQRYADATGPLSFFGLANITAVDTWGGIVSVSDGSGGASFSFQRQSSGTAFYVSRANTGGYISAVGAVTSLINAGEVPMLVATSGGATPVDIRVGSDTYSGASTGGTSTASGMRYLNIFAERARSATAGSDGRFLLATFFNKFITGDEWNELSRNPWQLFRESPVRIYSLPPAGTTQDLAASGSANASGSAALRADVGLAGVGVSVAGGAAGAVASVSLAAAGLALFSGSAGLEAGATVTLTASGLAQAAGAAGLSADVLLAGAGAAEAAGSAGLAAELRALAAGGAVAGGSATLSGGAAGEIGAVGGVDAGGAAGLLITVSLAGLGGAVAGGSAALETGAGGDLGAAGGAVAAGGGVLSATVALTAAGFVQAMGAGALAVQFPLSAFGAGLAGGSAALSGAGGLVLVADGRFRVRDVRLMRVRDERVFQVRERVSVR